MEDVDKFDERRHETERLRMILRYSLVAIAMFSAGVSQCQCGDWADKNAAFRRGKAEGENKALKQCLEEKN